MLNFLFGDAAMMISNNWHFSPSYLNFFPLTMQTILFLKVF